MEDRETARMRKYGESKTTLIMMATVPRVTSGSGLRKFQADGFLLDRVYSIWWSPVVCCSQYVSQIVGLIAPIHAMKACKRSVKLDSSFNYFFMCNFPHSLTPALDRGELSGSPSGPSNRKISRYPLNWMLCGPQNQDGLLEKWKISCHYQDSNLGFSSP